MSNFQISQIQALEALNLGDATPLHIAAFLNHSGVVKTLLEADANIHAYDKQHQTPLHLAVTRQHAETVNALVNAGASLSVRDQDAKSVGDRATEVSVPPAPAQARCAYTDDAIDVHAAPISAAAPDLLAQ